MKNKIINIFLIFSIVTLMFCLSGCARIDTYVIENDDGSISECVTVQLNGKEISALNDSNYNIDTIKSDIRTEAVNIVAKMREDLNIMAGLCNRPDLIDGIQIASAEWTADKFHLSVDFENEDVYNFYYYGTTEVESAKPEREEKFFYTKITYYSRPTLRRNVEYSILNQVFTKFANKYPKLLNSENLELTYTYIGDYKRLHSNADYSYNTNDKSYHVWKLDRVYDTDGNLKGFDVNKDVELYFLVANRANWIVLCLIIGLTISFVLIMSVLILRAVKQKGDNKKLINKLIKKNKAMAKQKK